MKRWYALYVLLCSYVCVFWNEAKWFAHGRNPIAHHELNQNLIHAYTVKTMTSNVMDMVLTSNIKHQFLIKLTFYLWRNWCHCLQMFLKQMAVRRLRGPPIRYIKWRVAHAPGMPGTFSPPLRVSGLDMHQGTCVTHVPWFILHGTSKDVFGQAINGYCVLRGNRWRTLRVISPKGRVMDTFRDFKVDVRVVL